MNNSRGPALPYVIHTTVVNRSVFGPARSRLKLLSRRYAKSRFEEDRTRTEIGRNSSGFAAEQMTIDSEDSFQTDNGSPPVPSSPTGVQSGSPPPSPATKSKQHFTFPTVNEIDEPAEPTKR